MNMRVWVYILSCLCCMPLNAQVSTQYAVNAQGRTGTWYRSLPHCVMLHLVYHCNRNPKKP